MDSTRLLRRRHERIAPYCDALESGMERLLLRRERALLAGQAQGRVLEVGVGTGKSLPFYSDQVDLFGIDSSARMLDRARRRAMRLARPVMLLRMDVESLGFADDSFDCVVSTCVFCCVDDPVVGLREIRRVCKPGGFLLMLERVRTELPVLGALVDRLNFIPLHLYGSNINRRTIDNLANAGFAHVAARDVWLDTFKRIHVRNDKGDRSSGRPRRGSTES